MFQKHVVPVYFFIMLPAGPLLPRVGNLPASFITPLIHDLCAGREATVVLSPANRFSWVNTKIVSVILIQWASAGCGAPLFPFEPRQIWFESSLIPNRKSG